MKRAFIAVEGPHDVELVGALLTTLDSSTRRIRRKSEVEAGWHALIPTAFPFDDDLARRMPVPVFFEASTRSLAVMVAEGVQRLCEVIEETVAVLDTLDIIGLVLDADEQESLRRWSALRASPAATRLGVTWPDAPGRVSLGPPRFGAFIMPDNGGKGTLEDLLLDAAAVVYPTLLAPARAFIEAVEGPMAALPRTDRRPFQKPAGRAKATVACIGAVLKPGKAIQTSIQDNAWFKDRRALTLPRIAAVRTFLADLLDLPVPSLP